MNGQKHKGSCYEKKLKGFLNSTEKFLHKSLKIAKTRTKKKFAVVLQKFVTMVTPAKPPPPKEEVLFMTYIISVEKEIEGWQKPILAALKGIKGMKYLSLDERGRIIVSGAADLVTFLIDIAKVKNAKLDSMQSGQCSRYLYKPQVREQVYGHGHGHGHGCGYRYGYKDGIHPFHGGYRGGHRMRSGYNPMVYRPFDYKPTQPQSFINDERMHNCPCKL